jgi:hypothetical protein
MDVAGCGAGEDAAHDPVGVMSPNSMILILSPLARLRPDGVSESGDDRLIAAQTMVVVVAAFEAEPLRTSEN